MIRGVNNSGSKGTGSDLLSCVCTNKILARAGWKGTLGGRRRQRSVATIALSQALHKSTDCTIIGNQLAKTLQEAEASNSLKFYLNYYTLGWLQEQQIAV